MIEVAIIITAIILLLFLYCISCLNIYSKLTIKKSGNLYISIL